MCTRMTSPVVIRQRRPNRVLKGFFIVVYSRQLNRLNLRIDRQEHERSWEIPTTCWGGGIRELLLCPAGWQYGSTTATSPTVSLAGQPLRPVISRRPLNRKQATCRRRAYGMSLCDRTGAAQKN